MNVRKSILAVVTLAVVLMSVSFLGTPGSSTAEARAQELKKKVALQEWVANHRGFLTLGNRLKKELRKGQITLNQANTAFRAATELDDETLINIAALYKYDREYDALVQNIKTASDAAGGNVKILDGEIQRDCNAASDDFWWGCSLSCSNCNCNEAAFAYWCVCMGGAYMDNGFCYLYG